MKTLVASLILILATATTIQAQWVSQTVPANTGSIFETYIIDSNVIWAEMFEPGFAPAVLRTTDGGTNWTQIQVNPPGLSGQFSLYSLEAVDANTAFVTINLNNPGSSSSTRVCKTTDGGLNWTVIPGIFTSQASYADFVEFFDLNNGLIFGDHQEIYTTNDGGITWTAVPPANLPPSTPNDDVALYKRTVVGNTIWVPVSSMRIYKSTDKGLTWTVSVANLSPSTPGNSSFLTGLAFQDANNGLASQGNNLSLTTDGGLTWTQVSYTGSFFRQGLTHITGAPNSYVSFSGSTTNGGLSVSNDNGLTWVQTSANPHNSTAFINNQLGWSGSIDVMYKLSGNILSTPKDLSSDNHFTISPNPSAGIINITSDKQKAFSLEVYDVVGKKVMHQQGSSFGQNVIDLSGHKKGIYLVHILSGEQRIIEKIVLQ